jgi:hypothetical protein
VLHRAGAWRRTAYHKALAPTSRLPHVVRLALSSSLPPLPFPSLHLAYVVFFYSSVRRGWEGGVDADEWEPRPNAA